MPCRHASSRIPQSWIPKSRTPHVVSQFLATSCNTQLYDHESDYQKSSRPRRGTLCVKDTNFKIVGAFRTSTLNSKRARQLYRLMHIAHCPSPVDYQSRLIETLDQRVCLPIQGIRSLYYRPRARLGACCSLYKVNLGKQTGSARRMIIMPKSEQRSCEIVTATLKLKNGYIHFEWQEDPSNERHTVFLCSWTE